MTKILLLLLALPASLFAMGGSFEASNNIRGQADARYVLRNPYYDGSQSVTVASFTNAGASTLTGKVGIGKAPGSYELDVNGGIYAQYASVFASNVSVGGSSFSVGTSTLVVSAGKVGVGTASPTSTSKMTIRNDIASGAGGLDIRSPNEARILLAAGEDANPSYLEMKNKDEVTAVYLHTAANSYFNGGNVGIGTTQPTSKLTVSSGTITVDGNVQTAIDMSLGATVKTFRPYSADMATLKALAPAYTGVYIDCSDCPTATLLRSTGTSAGNWADAADRTASPW